MSDEPMRVLSLGAGVQSTTVALMAIHGEIPPIEHAIFADTGDEPASVYRHLEWLTPILTDAGMKVHVVTSTDGVALSVAMKEAAVGIRRWAAQPPVFVRRPDGGTGQLRRQCTKGHKIEPIERQIKKLAGTFRKRPPAGVVLVEQIFGISWDELQRTRTPTLAWIRYDYPLVDARMTRHDCLLWMERHGYPRPPRSACVFCPYRSDNEWRHLRDTEPEGWAAAIDFDRNLRTGYASRHMIDGEMYVHRSLVPLDQVDLSTPEDRGQLSLFDQECEGMCGL